jgi:hypothetical protein
VSIMRGWDETNRLDRRSRADVLTRMRRVEELLEKNGAVLHEIELKLEDVTVDVREAKASAAGAERESALTNGRVARNEKDIGDLRRTLHGDPTNLADAGGVVGTLRSTELFGKWTFGVLTVVVLPILLLIASVYINRYL